MIKNLISKYVAIVFLLLPSFSSYGKLLNDPLQHDELKQLLFSVITLEQEPNLNDSPSGKRAQVCFNKAASTDEVRNYIFSKFKEVSDDADVNYLTGLESYLMTSKGKSYLKLQKKIVALTQAEDKYDEYRKLTMIRERLYPEREYTDDIGHFFDLSAKVVDENLVLFIFKVAAKDSHCAKVFERLVKEHQ